MLRWLFTLLLSGPLVSWRDDEAAEAHGRRKRRKKRHKHGRPRRHGKHKKNQKRCRSKSRAKTCANRCGIVKNNCKKRVDCGSCSCDPPCPVCQTCDDVTRTCQPEPATVGDPCGEPDQVCQSDGTCACDDDGTCGGVCGCEAGFVCDQGQTNHYKRNRS